MHVPYTHMYACRIVWHVDKCAIMSHSVSKRTRKALRADKAWASAYYRQMLTLHKGVRNLMDTQAFTVEMLDTKTKLKRRK